METPNKTNNMATTDSRRQFQQGINFDERRTSRQDDRYQRRQKHRAKLFQEKHDHHKSSRGDYPAVQDSFFGPSSEMAHQALLSTTFLTGGGIGYFLQETMEDNEVEEDLSHWYVMLKKRDRKKIAEPLQAIQFVKTELIDAADNLTSKQQLDELLTISMPTAKKTAEEVTIHEYMRAHNFKGLVKATFPKSMTHEMISCMAQLASRNGWACASVDLSDYLTQLTNEAQLLSQAIDMTVEKIDEMSGPQLFETTSQIITLMEKSIKNESAQLVHEAKLESFATKLNGSRLAKMIDHLSQEEKSSFAQRVRAVIFSFGAKMMGDGRCELAFIDLTYVDQFQRDNYVMISQETLTKYGVGGRRGVGHAQVRHHPRRDFYPPFRRRFARTREESIEDTIKYLRMAAKSSSIDNLARMMGNLRVDTDRDNNHNNNRDDDGKERDPEEEERKNDGKSSETAFPSPMDLDEIPRSMLTPSLEIDPTLSPRIPPPRIDLKEEEEPEEPVQQQPMNLDESRFDFAMSLDDMDDLTESSDDELTLAPRVQPPPTVELKEPEEQDEQKERNQQRSLETRAKFEDTIKQLKKRCSQFIPLTKCKGDYNRWHANVRSVIAKDWDVLEKIYFNEMNYQCMFEAYLDNRRTCVSEMLASVVIQLSRRVWRSGYPYRVRVFLDDNHFKEKYLDALVTELIKSKVDTPTFFRGEGGVELYDQMLDSCKERNSKMYPKLFGWVSQSLSQWDNEALVALRVFAVLRRKDSENCALKNFVKHRLIQHPDLLQKVRSDVMVDVFKELTWPERCRLVDAVVGKFEKFVSFAGMFVIRIMVTKKRYADFSIFFANFSDWERARILKYQPRTFIIFALTQPWRDVGRKIETFAYVLNYFCNMGDVYFLNLGNDRQETLNWLNGVIEEFWEQKIGLFHDFEKRKEEYSEMVVYEVNKIEDGLDRKLKRYRKWVNRLMKAEVEVEQNEQ